VPIVLGVVLVRMRGAGLIGWCPGAAASRPINTRR